MDDEQELPSIEKLRVQFEQHKLHCKLQHRENNKLISRFKLDKPMEELNANIRELRLGISQLHHLQRDMSCWADVHAIEELSSSISNERCEEQQRAVNDNLMAGCSSSSTDISAKQLDEEKRASTIDDSFAQPLQEKLEERQELPFMRQEKLIISSDSHPCLFDNCRRRVDSQLLLLHYLSDHSDQSGEAVNFLHCHKLWQDQRVVLSFDPKRCELKQNQVIGLIEYTGFNLPSCSGVFSSFLSRELRQLQGDIQIVVLVCKTSANLLPEAADQVFLIWLVMPHHHQLQLQATLRLCGRDAAVQASSTLKVRPVRDSQKTPEFMPVDDNYWRLSYGEIQKISNELRDELHLEISIAQLNSMQCD